MTPMCSWPAIAALVVVSASAALGPVAHTKLGSVYGQVGTSEDGHRCEEWLGIPYADPPNGTRRFAPPVARTSPFPASGLKATAYGRWCPQLYDGKDYGDEDCLSLNVWRPITQDSNLAVMVWIYGGAFVNGDDGDTASLNTYDSCGLVARHDVVVVGMNYRVGPFGFLAFSDAAGIEGNWGMQDQREALRWVQQNIRSFGGNAKKVTIFGESAGAISVWYHIASPRSKGLFHGAISQSGFPTAVTGTFALHRTGAYAANLGCNETASLRTCLMTKSVKDLIDAADEDANPFVAAGWNPCIDGRDMPEAPGKLLNDTRSSAVPFLAGFNTDEANVFVYPDFPVKMNDTQFYDFVSNSLDKFPQWDPAHAMNKSLFARIYAEYPLSKHTDNRAVASSLLSDSSFRCGTVAPATSYSERAKFYLYRFNHRTSFTKNDPTPGVFHGLDLPYVFGTPATYQANFTQGETALSNRMQAIWTSFAKDFTPKGATVEFPVFTNATRRGLLLDTSGDSIDSDFRGDFCNFWASIYAEEDRLTNTFGMHARLTSHRTFKQHGIASIYV